MNINSPSHHQPSHFQVADKSALDQAEQRATSQDRFPSVDIGGYSLQTSGQVKPKQTPRQRKAEVARLKDEAQIPLRKRIKNGTANFGDVKFSVLFD